MSTEKVKIKRDFTISSISNGACDLVIFSSNSDKHPGKKIFCEPETIHSEKTYFNLYHVSGKKQYWKHSPFYWWNFDFWFFINKKRK